MNIETAQKTLEGLGFDKKESSVYLAFLKIGETTATKISKETKIERTLVYYIVEKLINKGFLSFKLKNNVKYYCASNPDKLLEDLKEKEKSFQKLKPFLDSLIKQHVEEEIKVDVFKEFAGLKAVTNIVFKDAKEFLFFGEEGQVQKNYPIYYKQYLRKLKENNIKEKVIIRADLKGKILKSKKSEFRYISKDILSPTTTLITGNKVLITIWEKPMHNILITSKKISDSYRSYFNHLWKLAK